ncbi:MAG: hypothetical protein AAFO81_06845 [Pseudomonadota bacterium]
MPALTMLVVSLMGAWLLCAVLGVVASRTLATHALGVAARRKHIVRLNVFGNALAILQCTALAASYALIIRREPVVQQWPLTLHIALFASILGYIVLALVRWLLPDLPVSHALKRLAGVYLIAVIAVWLMISTVGVWRINAIASLWYFVAIGLLAMSLMLSGFSRPYFRGAITVAQHICKHGSHARREATLKRLLAKWYPLLAVSAAVMVTTALLLIYRPAMLG